MASAIAQSVVSCSEVCSIFGLLNRVFVCGSILQRPRCSTLHLNWNVLSAYGFQMGETAAWITRFPSRFCEFLFTALHVCGSRHWFGWSSCGQRSPVFVVFRSPPCLVVVRLTLNCSECVNIQPSYPAASRTPLVSEKSWITTYLMHKHIEQSKQHKILKDWGAFWSLYSSFSPCFSA